MSISNEQIIKLVTHAEQVVENGHKSPPWPGFREWVQYGWVEIAASGVLHELTENPPAEIGSEAFFRRIAAIINEAHYRHKDEIYVDEEVMHFYKTE